MFQLIVTIISIALIVALALASIFYGGSAFTNSSAKTAEAALINGGQQISAAQVLYRSDWSQSAVGLASLTTTNPVSGLTYLQSVPSLPSQAIGNWDLTASGDYAYVALDTAANASTNAICKRVLADAKGSGLETVTAATSIAFANPVTYECVQDGTNTYFAYKL